VVVAVVVVGVVVVVVVLVLVVVVVVLLIVLLFVSGAELPAPLVEVVAMVATTVVAAEVAIVDPFLFVAVTATRSVEPTSPATSTCVGSVAPATAMHAPLELSQRFH
jgi:hypothetical protein